jgi:tetratricopeptide (TPR) repeat protein
MVMPFGRKSTLAQTGNKAPAEVDFNRLWDRAYLPVVQQLGYEAVRADQDTGSLIITQMLERLYFADLVLADMTIPNGNVYYEVGIRHAARATGCVLLAADWSKQLFDVAQMRTVRYPLPEGDVTDDTAQAIQAVIRGAIPRLGAGRSPMHESIDGYPGNVDPSAASTVKGRMVELAAFQGQLRAVRAAPRDQRMHKAGELAAAQDPASMTAPMAIALLLLLRDCAEKDDDWTHALAFIERLPTDFRSVAEVQEQRALALSHAGQHLEAIAELDKLIKVFGPTPERLGLLGGRYKRLFRNAADPGDRREHLNRTIECYENGMELDLNEYYCSSNLPRLYRARARKGDEERSKTVLRVVMAACERAKKRGATDPWLRPTLLAAAFDAGNPDKAEELADEVRDEGHARWKLDSVRDDLKSSLAHVKDSTTRERLEHVMRGFSP